MENTANIDLIRDHVDSFILRFLAQSDSYGYDIHRAISAATQGVYEIKQPTLYSCLKRLEKNGFITSYDGETSNGAQRKYYAITEKGRQFLETDIRQWEFSRTLLDRLLSDRQIDLSTVDRPFDPSELRPRTRRGVGVAEAADTATDLLPDASDDPIAVPASTAEATVTDPESTASIPTDENATAAQTSEIAATTSTDSTAPVPEQTGSTTETVTSPADSTDAGATTTDASALFTPQTAVQIDMDTYASAQAAEQARTAPILQDFLRERLAYSDDYRASMDEIFASPVDDTEEPAIDEPAREEAPITAFNYGELKEKAQSEGYRLQPYSKSVTSSYYSMNFIFSARLRRDALLLLYAFMFLEVLVSFLALDRIANLGYLFYIVTGAVLLVFPIFGIILYLIKPDKRIRADFDFKTSLSGMIMLMINLVIISMLLAFFVFGADLGRPDSLVKPLLYPALLFIDLPIYTLFYAALYNTKRYHLK